MAILMQRRRRLVFGVDWNVCGVVVGLNPFLIRVGPFYYTALPDDDQWIEDALAERQRGD